MLIIIHTEDFRERIATLASDEMMLPALIPALEAWLRENKGKLKPGNYVADVGFSAREDATGEVQFCPLRCCARWLTSECGSISPSITAPMKKRPNKALEPTSTSVMPRATLSFSDLKQWIESSNEARVMPAVAVAHL